jgi:hypothetical protein
MNHILQIAALFLAQLGFGSALILPFFPVKVIGKAFLRYYYGFIVIMLALFLFCMYRLGQFHINYLILAGLAAWIWALSFTAKFTKLESGLMWFYAFCSLAILFIYPQKFIFHGSSFSSYAAWFSILLLSTLFINYCLMNMIFGHWYLVNNELPISYLIKTSKVFIAITYLRVASVALVTFLAYKNMEPAQFDRIIDFMGHGVFFWARILAGLGLPLLVAHLSFESAKIKSNQSATGILYAGLVFVLMGEILALYLYTLTGYFF